MSLVFVDNIFKGSCVSVCVCTLTCAYARKRGTKVTIQMIQSWLIFLLFQECQKVTLEYVEHVYVALF